MILLKRKKWIYKYLTFNRAIINGCSREREKMIIPRLLSKNIYRFDINDAILLIIVIDRIKAGLINAAGEIKISSDCVRYDLLLYGYNNLIMDDKIISIYDLSYEKIDYNTGKKYTMIKPNEYLVEYILSKSYLKDGYGNVNYAMICNLIRLRKRRACLVYLAICWTNINVEAIFKIDDLKVIYQLRENKEIIRHLKIDIETINNNMFYNSNIHINIIKDGKAIKEVRIWQNR